MDWKSINFDWNRARAFLVTAEEGSFSAAAKALKVSQSTLGRQVSALEEELEIALFERVGKGIEITPGGLELLEHVRRMGEAANRLSISALGQASNIQGNVTISATEATAIYLLPPILKELRQEEPEIQIEIIATNSTSDLRKREADIAIRNLQPQHQDLIAQKIKDSKAYLYATPEYVTSHGPFREKADLNKASFIGLVDNAKFLEGLNKLGLNLTPENFIYATENHIVHWSFVKCGAGIGVMPKYVGDKDPDVQRVLPNYININIETWVVSHKELKTSRRIRFVFDFLVNALNSL